MKEEQWLRELEDQIFNWTKVPKEPWSMVSDDDLRALIAAAREGLKAREERNHPMRKRGALEAFDAAIYHFGKDNRDIWSPQIVQELEMLRGIALTKTGEVTGG